MKFPRTTRERLVYLDWCNIHRSFCQPFVFFYVCHISGGKGLAQQHSVNHDHAQVTGNSLQEYIADFHLFHCLLPSPGLSPIEHYGICLDFMKFLEPRPSKHNSDRPGKCMTRYVNATTSVNYRHPCYIFIQAKAEATRY